MSTTQITTSDEVTVAEGTSSVRNGLRKFGRGLRQAQRAITPPVVGTVIAKSVDGVESAAQLRHAEVRKARRVVRAEQELTEAQQELAKFEAEQARKAAEKLAEAEAAVKDS